MAKLKIKKSSNVNDPDLKESIQIFIEDIVSNDSYAWRNENQLDSFKRLVKQMLNEMMDQGYFDQPYVKMEIIANLFIIDIQYRQRNCINTTKIHLEFELR